MITCQEFYKMVQERNPAYQAILEDKAVEFFNSSYKISASYEIQLFPNLYLLAQPIMLILKGQRAFICSSKIICKAITKIKQFYIAGNERQTENVLNIVINNYRRERFYVDKDVASEMFYIGGFLSLLINDTQTGCNRLKLSIQSKNDNIKAHQSLIIAYLKAFQFQKIFYHARSQFEIINNHEEFVFVRAFVEVCIVADQQKWGIFISLMEKIEQKAVKERQSLYFGLCLAYFKYLTLEHHHAYYLFKQQFESKQVQLNALEAMCLCSYRLKQYMRALAEFYQMCRIMPYESGWKLIIATVCYLKIGYEKRAMAMLAKVNENSLTFEEDVFYCGVLCLVGQQEKANNRLKVLPKHISSIMNTQKAIVMILCEQKQGNRAQVNRILQSLSYLEKSEQSIEHRYMEFQQALFLANYYFERNRFAEGRHWVKKVRRIGKSLKMMATIKTVQILMEELNQQKQVEVELIFR